jgi:hypothetical protein
VRRIKSCEPDGFSQITTTNKSSNKTG